MVSKSQAPVTQPASVEVVFIKPHTHNGKPLVAGAKLNVSADQKAWLLKLGVIGGTVGETHETSH
jgi:hypothetical protein